MGNTRARCWVDRRAAALLVPRQDGEGELWMLAAGAAPAALAAMLELGPSAPAKAGARVPATSLAALLAGPDGQVPLRTDVDPWLRTALSRLRAHWRVDSRWSGENPQVHRCVEAIDCANGLWLVAPDGSDVLLEPAHTADLWRGLAALFPRA